MRAPLWYPYEQGSVAWLKERCGCLTASRMADATAFLKGGKEAEARKKYKIELIAERMTDTMVSRFVNDAMAWGIEKEPLARARYEEVTGELVQLCGFAIHGDIPYFGASPDGLIGEDGLIEIKCPTSETYAGWLIGGVVPEQHKPQMLAQMAVTGRSFVDFFAFDPRVKVASHQHFLRRYEPAEEDILAVEDAAKKFLAEVDALFDTVISQEVT
jgi:putative phage-type endonuclease